MPGAIAPRNRHTPTTPRSAAPWLAGVMVIAFLALVLTIPVLALAGSDSASDGSRAQADSVAEKPAQQPQAGGGGDGVLEGRLLASLPLTGLDVMILAVAAMSLVGSGMAFRALSRPRQPAPDLASRTAPAPALAVAEAQRQSLPPSGS